MPKTRRLSWLAIIGPGILVAATGVGAGDLATGAFCGSKLGVAVLWAVLVGAGLKFVLNEGLARWQLATGTTLIEGCVRHFGSPVLFGFMLYFVFWSYAVASALMSACGVTAHAIFPGVHPERLVPDGLADLFGSKTAVLSGKIVFGLLHSAVAVVLVRRGGYRLFERVMSVCIAVMFVTVVVTAAAVRPSWPAVAAGVFLPQIPDFHGEGLEWTIALMGGVGGTVTVLCYGYWIREERREGLDQLTVCRIDLATGYLMTALFGLGMVVIGSRISVDGGGAQLIVQLSDQLERELGAWGAVAKWAFLVGAWGAVFSSLLGVWQSLPYLFADLWTLLVRGADDSSTEKVSTESWPYRGYLLAIATVPALGLWIRFEMVQKLYAIVGALFIPMLAAALLVLNGRTALIGAAARNRSATTCVLAATLVLFLVAGWFTLQNTLLQ